MSRIGKLPVYVPENLKVSYQNNVLEITNGKNKLSLNIPFGIELKIVDNKIEIFRKSDEKRYKALHGTVRALINNMVIGLTKGFEKRLELVGVGYNAKVSGKTLELNVGFSHSVKYEIPEGIDISVEANTKIIVKGYDKQLVGQVAAEIRSIKKPEPYKGKGIRYENEYIAMKAGKRSK